VASPSALLEKDTWDILLGLAHCQSICERQAWSEIFERFDLPATTMAIGLVDWDVMVATLRGCLAVQKWLRSESPVVFELSDFIPRSKGSEERHK